MKTPRSWRRRLLGCFTALVSTYLTLVFLAWLLPLFGPPWLFAKGVPTEVPWDAIVPDPELGSALRPNVSARFGSARRPGAEYRTNAAGWRDEPFRPAGEGDPRILLLGDSITFGTGVAAEERYGDRLEALLPGAVVDTCAVMGFELNQLLIVARRELPLRRPDLVLYGFCLNDLRVADTTPMRSAAEKAREATISNLIELRPLARMAGNVLRLAQAAQPSRTGVKRSEAGTLRRWQDPAQREALAGRLTELQALCRAADADLKLVIFPYTFQFDRPPDDPLRAPQRHLLEICERLGIPALDLYPTLAAPQEPIYLPNDNCHPNAVGHNLAAEAIAAWLTGD